MITIEPKDLYERIGQLDTALTKTKDALAEASSRAGEALRALEELGYADLSRAIQTGQPWQVLRKETDDEESIEEPVASA